MARLIQLSSRQNKIANIKHSMFSDCEKYTPEQLDELIVKIRSGEKTRQDLVLALRSVLRYTLGRYLAHYRRYVEYHMDDMVCEGFLAITKFVEKLDLSKKHDILKIAMVRIKKAVETYLNDNREALTPSLRTQQKSPQYKSTKGEITEGVEPVDEDDIFKRDVLEALEALEPRDRIDAYLLNPLYWGKREQELADLLGVDQATINRRKKSLYRQYLKVTR